MSYTGPEFEPERRRSPLRRPLVVVPAVLIPVVAGWLAYGATGDDGGSSGKGDGNARTAASSSAPLSPPPSAGTADAKTPAKPLTGKVIVIDPGHNPTNYQHPSEINRKVDIGTTKKECDTTGTSTNAASTNSTSTAPAYAEAQFTLDVAHRMRTLLEREGAKVKLTQDADRPFGPCVDERARIGNAANADAVVSIHADGSAKGNRGFHVILPGAVHEGAADTRPIVGPSKRLGEFVANGFRRTTGSAPSNYVGAGTGLVTRTDLGGLNLSTVPKVFIECGNMRDREDAAQLTSGAWRQKAAQGISEGIVSFLRG
ncbi:N-acetylmuramoyl-L-alanine amidase [Streptomyces roseirectus]|uniref:N-acetylmuramoyl-L-alanine amidase n=1 Tax=Streptomyces roseirectus TaxID=2768066 RepID=A0A7H0IJN2_9ACTN|nr:N-acetylmuramoyl-L-alanine amidase [Streptomyces roseirectus]QNP72998.1 N-acetylmuramoyl-L-alanine amidase [Streptomyces roseirectus]